MAAIFVIAGGLIGFALGVTSWTVLDANLVTAVAIWWGSACLGLGLGVVLALAPWRRVMPREPHATGVQPISAKFPLHLQAKGPMFSVRRYLFRLSSPVRPQQSTIS